MSINASASRIAALTRDLEAKWNFTREYWTDHRSREFEQKYLRELLSSVNMLVAASQELDKIVSKVKKDCE
jgi:hypothetical protein